MLQKTHPILSVIFAAVFLLAACEPAGGTPDGPTAGQEAAAGLAADESDTSSVLPNGSSIKAGLVTDIDGINGTSPSTLAWKGLQKAARDMGVQVIFIESKQPGDYTKNIDSLAAEGYGVIVAVGSAMGDATAAKAKQYPGIKFAIVDKSYARVKGLKYPDNSAVEFYTNNGLGNVTSLMFAEDQAGFLAGVLAGGMSKSGMVCSVSASRDIQSERYMLSFFQGATWQAGPDLKIMNNYINIKTTETKVPSFDDSTHGKEAALRLIGNDFDVVFAVGGDAVNGALLAAKERNVMAVGSDIDRYDTYPEARPALLTSAVKNVDTAVYNYLKSVAVGSVKAGISIGTLQNGGVGLAPFHDWDSKIPPGLKARIQKAAGGIKDGSIKIDLPE